MNSSQIKSQYNIPVTTRRVQQILQNEPTLEWVKRQAKPKLTPAHKQKRMDFAEKVMSWTTEWAHVIFSDEKKFNLDGPDNCQFYWHSLRHEKQISFSRNFGGGSLMTWLGFCSQGKLRVNFISCRTNSKDYIRMLSDNLLVEGIDLLGENLMFQQDNASIHKSRETLKWMDDHDIQVLEWPSLSPDLNPVENIWAWLVRKVYANGKQYGTVNELKLAILEAWDACPQNYLENLVNSMPKRIFEVIKNHGDKTNY